MGEYFRLEDFDDFLEIAKGCQNVFFQTNEVSAKQTQLVAYAGRVYWKQDFVHSDEADAFTEILHDDLRAKRVLETSDEVFR